MTDYRKRKRCFTFFFARDNVTVSPEVKQELSQNVSNGNITENMFTAAQQEIYELMALDVFQRFVTSPIFREAVFLRVKDKLRDPEQRIKSETKTIQGKTHFQCFSGAEALEWVQSATLVAGCALVTREQGLSLLQKAMDDGLFASTEGPSHKTFSDSDQSFFVFTPGGSPRMKK